MRLAHTVIEVDRIVAWAGGAAGGAAAAIAAQHTSSYRVKFKRKEFLELVEIAEPKIIYHRGECTSLPMTAL